MEFINSLKTKRKLNGSAQMEEFQRASESLVEQIANENLQILTTRGLFGDLLE
jgi:hypothetical protein